MTNWLTEPSKRRLARSVRSKKRFSAFTCDTRAVPCHFDACSKFRTLGRQRHDHAEAGKRVHHSLILQTGDQVDDGSGLGHPHFNEHWTRQASTSRPLDEFPTPSQSFRESPSEPATGLVRGSRSSGGDNPLPGAHGRRLIAYWLQPAPGALHEPREGHLRDPPA